jgi:hypothetical protein
MESLKMYCFSLSNTNLEKIKKMNYTPVGLGKNKFDNNWLTDNSDINISFKNSWYGENTFYYWLWKNNLDKNFNTDWIGFCHYRRFWVYKDKDIETEDFHNSYIKDVPREWKNYDVVLRDEVYVNGTKFSKVLKHGKRQLLKNPFVFFSKKKMTVKLHYDMYHGYGEMDKAIEMLDVENRESFRKWVNTAQSFNANNVFICRSKKLYEDYCKTLFSWLERCEEIFGFDPNRSYSMIRVYAFLAERFLSYWFKKNSNYILCPMKFHDITNDNINF